MIGRVPARGILVAALVALPTVVLFTLLYHPEWNVSLDAPIEHIIITTNVSLLAMGVAILVARAAWQLREYRILLLALGFMSMAGIFVVHGLATPGVLLQDTTAAGAVIVVSAQLSLTVPALFFAVRYTPLWRRLERAVPPQRLVLAVGAALLLYAIVGLAAPRVIWAMDDAVAGYVGASDTGYSYGTGAYGVVGHSHGAPTTGYGGLDWGPAVPLIGLTTIALFGFAAVRSGRDFMRSRLPTQGALVASFLLLAQAQLAQVLTAVWSLTWWEYHALMLVAVVVALGAIFIELDRRRGLERFLPATLVERVVSGDALRLAGERHVATILFADLRGSTALADRLAPEAVVEVLNSYLGALARCVFAQGGVLDKFLGDGLMAIFGVFPDGSEGAVAAARAALMMRERVGALTAERAAKGEETVRFGVGIHTGEVVLGAVGLPERSDYTALGDTVNVASRLESLCKEFSVDVVLSQDVMTRLRSAGIAVRSLGSTPVRGKQEQLDLFTLA